MRDSELEGTPARIHARDWRTLPRRSF